MFAAPASRVSRRVQLALGHGQWHCLAYKYTGSRQVSGVVAHAAVNVRRPGAVNGVFGVLGLGCAVAARRVCFHNRAV